MIRFTLIFVVLAILLNILGMVGLSFIIDYIPITTDYIRYSLGYVSAIVLSVIAFFLAIEIDDNL